MRTLDEQTADGAAIAVGRGRVLGVGSARAMRVFAGLETQWIDAPGATVLPGLIDPHLHLFALAAAHAELSCGRFRRVGDLLAAVATHAAAVPPGEWVRGAGFDEARLDRLPTPAELDRVADGRPVRLRHRSLHGSLLSGIAWRRLGSGTGRVGRSALVVGREERLRALVGPLPAAIFRRGLVQTGQALMSRGVTTVADATPRRRRALDVVREVMAQGDFPLRVFAMRPPGAPAWRVDGRLGSGPVKVVLHEEGRRLRPRPQTLARIVARTAAAGDRLAVHCIGATALAAALEAFDRLPPAWRRGHRLEHVGECPPSMVAEIARLGLTVVTNPAFVWFRGDVYRREMPAAAHGWLYRAGSLVRAGVPLAAASDAPVVPADPWFGLAAARERRTRRGAVLGAGERLDAATAFGAFTAGAAASLGAPMLGRLRVGGPADLTVVAGDPWRASPAALRATAVRLTMIDGEIAWRT